MSELRLYTLYYLVSSRFLFKRFVFCQKCVPCPTLFSSDFHLLYAEREKMMTFSRISMETFFISVFVPYFVSVFVAIASLPSGYL